MKKLLNTLYVTREQAYLAKEGENIIVLEDNKVIGRYPIHILEGIICFNYLGVSPRLMKLCVEHGISIAFLTPQGRYCGQLIGEKNGNVLLRRQQYRMADDQSSIDFVRNIVYAKTLNTKTILRRGMRDHGDTINGERIQQSLQVIDLTLLLIKESKDKDSLRGMEGLVAKAYFDVFDELIVQQKEDFYFWGRNRRPPRDTVNAMLSFLYSLLAYDCQSALEAVGIDSYVGFMHTDRPGRASMALDLMEEFRGYMVDRTVLSMINMQMVNKKDFEVKESQAVMLKEKGRNKIIEYWQKRKQKEIEHPFLKEKVKIGLLPYIQAMLLNRYIRGDLEAYPPFLMRG